MPLKGEVRTKYMREYMQRYRATERVGKAPQLQGATKVHISEHETAELRAENGRLRNAARQAEALIEQLQAELKARPNVTSAEVTPGVVAGEMNKKTFKLISSLDSPRDGEVLNAARLLVSNLKAGGSDLRTLSDALAKEWTKQQTPKAKPVTVDYAAVDVAIDRCVADRDIVTFDRVWKAIVAAVPVLDEGGAPARATIGYTYRRLQDLGFTATNKSMRSFHRAA
jgi:hypothetical protein